MPLFQWATHYWRVVWEYFWRFWRYRWAIRGDYTTAGAQLPDRRADIPRLLTTLRDIGATHFMHLIWDQAGVGGAGWPYGW